MKPEDPELIREMDRRREAARVLLASAESFWEPTLTVNTYDEKQAAYAAELRTIMWEKAKEIEKAVKRFHKRHDRFLNADETLAALMDERLLKRKDAYDPWGNLYRVSNVYFLWQDYPTFQLLSIGPDEHPGTRDDVTITYQPEIRRRGWFGDMALRVEEAVMAPMAKMGMAMRADKEKMLDSNEIGGAAPADKKQVRIRQYFPETLFFNPAIITDPYGSATLLLTMADSITTWRMATMASSLRGELGSAATPIRVFQDFFIDIDLPVALTQNDRISIPIAVYNYLPRSQRVELELTQENWFELLDEPVKEIVL
jgi:hypothetical protein